jgi:hypothetical protein
MSLSRRDWHDALLLSLERPEHVTAVGFVDDPIVPSTTRPPSASFQNVAKLRLNMLFAGSTG